MNNNLTNLTHDEILEQLNPEAAMEDGKFFDPAQRARLREAKKQKEKEVEAMLKAHLGNNEKSIEFDVLSILPFKDDALTKIYMSFKKHTNIPIELPIFSFFGFLSAHLLQKDAKIKVPSLADPLDMDVWTICLAPSGASKTFSKSVIQGCIREDLQPDQFSDAVGPAGFVEELQESNRSMYFLDECAQRIKDLENTSNPMSEIKQYLMKTYDHQEITRKIKSGKTTVENPCLTVLWLNTVDTFIKFISEESLKDGFSQRFMYVVADRDFDRQMEEYCLYETGDIVKGIADAIMECFEKTKFDYYEVTEEAVTFYKEAFKFISISLFNGSINESFYRRVMFNCFKYAVMYHIILGKQGNQIDIEDIGLGLKVSILHLHSIKKLLEYKHKGLPREKGRREELRDRVIKAMKAIEKAGREVTNREVMRKVSAIRTSEEAAYYIDIVQNIDKPNKPMRTPVEGFNQKSKKGNKYAEAKGLE